MASDIHVALGPLGIEDYKKLRVNNLGELLVAGIDEVRITAPTGPFKVKAGGIATDVATNPLPIPLTARVSLAIRNLDAANTIYLGPDALVTADNVAGTGGWEIFARSDLNLDLEAGQVFFFIMEAGKTATYKIFEIAST